MEPAPVEARPRSTSAVSGATGERSSPASEDDERLAEHEWPAPPPTGHAEVGGRTTSLSATLGVGAAVAATAVLGGVVQSRSPRAWYDRLRKPPGQPPSWLFGPVWTVLYLGLAWNGIRLWHQLEGPSRRRARALWIAQMATNAAWTPLFFGLRRPALAMVDQVALDAFALALRREVGRVDPATTKVLDAYLAWLAYATYLNAGILVRNR